MMTHLSLILQRYRKTPYIRSEFVIFQFFSFCGPQSQWAVKQYLPLVQNERWGIMPGSPPYLSPILSQSCWSSLHHSLSNPLFHGTPGLFHPNLFSTAIRAWYLDSKWLILDKTWAHGSLSILISHFLHSSHTHRQLSSHSLLLHSSVPLYILLPLPRISSSLHLFSLNG